MAQRGGSMIVDGNNIKMIRGDSETISISFVGKDGKPMSFSEEDIMYFTVKRSVNTKRIAIQKIIRDFPNGELRIDIEPSDTSDLAYGDYVYDIQFNKHDGTVKTIIPPSAFVIGGEVTYE